MSNKSIIAIIVAAGRGSRIKGEIPKQYLKIGGETILGKSVRAFTSHRLVTGVKVVIHPDDVALYNEYLGDLKILPPSFGGELRKDSVHMGLESIRHLQPDYVLIHDGARPFVSHDIIDKVIKELENHKAVIPVVPVIDTIKQCESGIVLKTLDRDKLYATQTPQGFHYNIIAKIHRELENEEMSDDAMLMEKFGIAIKTIEGEYQNFKITTKEDLMLAKTISGENKQVRTGIGFDVHAFIASRSGTIRMGGIDIPCEKSLEGHSDADVVLHAIVDALLGAMGKGDIGEYFPPSQPKWRGADSAIFVKYVKELLEEEKGIIQNIDVIIICELPKITPHKANMRKKISTILDIKQDQVNIKATTTEGLGFTGRKEGIAVQVVATIVKS